MHAYDLWIGIFCDSIFNFKCFHKSQLVIRMFINSLISQHLDFKSQFLKY